MKQASPTAASIKRRVGQLARPEKVPVLRGFFKTGPGEYGEGDVFIGASVPALRKVCRECRGASLETVDALLRSPVHEERLLALLLLVDMFRMSDARAQREIYDFYLSRTGFINNWDLVDSSAPHIVGAWLSGRSRAPLRALAKSRSVWERRIAIIATQHLIRGGEFDDALEIADMLLGDEHDLIHKAVGWMLREVGNRAPDVERRFLRTRHRFMPRTMLRYAIEKFPEAERRAYLAAGARSAGRAGPSATHRVARR